MCEKFHFEMAMHYVIHVPNGCSVSVLPICFHTQQNVGLGGKLRRDNTRYRPGRIYCSCVSNTFMSNVTLNHPSALSKAGVKVAHLDNNPYYGGDEASLTLDELALWADSRSTPSEIPEKLSNYLVAQRAKFTSVSRSPLVPDHPRHYSISLAPSLIPSVGPLISSLIASGVSRYGGYRLLERVGIYSSNSGLQNVPGSKEDVFKSSLSLIEKRRLMRFLIFASGDFENSKEFQGQEQTPFPEFLQSKFSLTQEMVDAIVYALAFCSSIAGLPCPCPCGAYDNDRCRCGPTRTYPLAQLPPLCRPVRGIAFPGRTLWRARRDCTGFLSRLCGQRWRIYSG